MSDARFIYVTTPSAALAEAIAERLVEMRLAACGNLLSGMRSIYRWQGAVQRAEECVLILKSTAELLPELIAQVRLMHPYECPCIVSLPIDAGYGPYLDWIRNETGKV